MSPPLPSTPIPTTRSVSAAIDVRVPETVPPVPVAVFVLSIRELLSSPVADMAQVARAPALGCVTVIVAPDANAVVTGAVRTPHRTPLVVVPFSTDAC